MKSFIFFFISFCFSLSLFGQSSSLYKHELGVNITNVLVRSLGNEAGFEASNFPITYKRLLSKKGRYLRTAIGFRVSQVDNVISLDEQVVQGDLKMGLEWRKNITDRLLFNYGFDGFAGYEENTVSNGVVELYDNEKRIGGDLFLGLHFLVKKRIALEIESTAYVLYANRAEETRFLTVSGSDMSDNQSRFETSLIPPQWLHLVIKF